MRKIVSLIVLITLLFNVTACEKKKEDDKLNSKYNVYFIMPDSSKRVYIGTVTGLSSCKYTASSYYSHRRSLIADGWDYVCCLRTSENECAAEEKYENK